MKTREQVQAAIKAGRGSHCIDGRDYSRLCDFFPPKDWEVLGCRLKEGVNAPERKAWTVEAIYEQLKADVAFGFEKALNQRGISASMMYEVVKMWMWVLDDDLEYHDSYAQYGLPLFKAVAVKYGFSNPIGDDVGDEAHYES